MTAMAPTKGRAAITHRPNTIRVFAEKARLAWGRVWAKGRPQPQQLNPSEVLLIKRSPQYPQATARSRAERRR